MDTRVYPSILCCCTGTRLVCICGCLCVCVCACVDVISIAKTCACMCIYAWICGTLMIVSPCNQTDRPLPHHNMCKTHKETSLLWQTQQRTGPHHCSCLLRLPFSIHPTLSQGTGSGDYVVFFRVLSQQSWFWMSQWNSATSSKHRQ